MKITGLDYQVVHRYVTIKAAKEGYLTYTKKDRAIALRNGFTSICQYRRKKGLPTKNLEKAKEFSVWLRERMMKKGYCQRDVVEGTGANRQSINNYYHGRTYPRADIRERIEEFLSD